MKKSKKQNEVSIDPYTGEKKPASEDAEDIVEIIPTDVGNRSGAEYLLEEESPLEKVAADEDADELSTPADSFTTDEDVQEHFDERQQFAQGGRQALEHDLEEHHALSPEISGGDLDSDWQSANMSGDEAVGGTAPTPDQDTVSDLGDAVGLNYDPDEPLDTEGKLLQRDEERWELDPRSGEAPQPRKRKGPEVRTEEEEKKRK